jgi:hypothetical protein
MRSLTVSVCVCAFAFVCVRGCMRLCVCVCVCVCHSHNVSHPSFRTPRSLTSWEPSQQPCSIHQACCRSEFGEGQGAVADECQTTKVKRG